ncbi:Uncharacterised protein [uncultured Flavonifractor sp.]|nr:Uncharacterised protein [uncultured Flavonifractor sp.]
MVDLHEGGLNGHLGPGHLEGILAVALVGQLDLVPVLVGDGQLVQLIALVGLDGDGHRPAAGGALGGHGHTAVVNVLVHADGVAAGAASAAAATASIGPLGYQGHIFGHLIFLLLDLCAILIPALECIAPTACWGGQGDGLIRLHHLGRHSVAAVAVKGNRKHRIRFQIIRVSYIRLYGHIDRGLVILTRLAQNNGPVWSFFCSPAVNSVIFAKDTALYCHAVQRGVIRGITTVVTGFDVERGAAIGTVSGKGTACKGDVLICAVLQVQVHAAHPGGEGFTYLLRVIAIVQELTISKRRIGQLFKVDAFDIAVLDGQIICGDGERLVIGCTAAEIQAIVKSLDGHVVQLQVANAVGHVIGAQPHIGRSHDLTGHIVFVGSFASHNQILDGEGIQIRRDLQRRAVLRRQGVVLPVDDDRLIDFKRLSNLHWFQQSDDITVLGGLHGGR